MNLNGCYGKLPDISRNRKTGFSVSSACHRIRQKLMSGMPAKLTGMAAAAFFLLQSVSGI